VAPVIVKGMMIEGIWSKADIGWEWFNQAGTRNLQVRGLQCKIEQDSHSQGPAYVAWRFHGFASLNFMP
jgi:hypothetical protein